MPKSLLCSLLTLLLLAAPACFVSAEEFSYPIVDTGVTEFYSDRGKIDRPRPGRPFYGQDAHYQNNPPSYTDNGDGTITDNVTGLIWQKNMGSPMTLEQAQRAAADLQLGGHDDWRVPTIKELYSLILFTGSMSREKIVPFLDTQYFEQPFGRPRPIDAQTWSATEYRGRTMAGMETLFGVNFLDGRIKGYPKVDPRRRGPKTMYFRFVRGNPDYGKNRFVDNEDGTIYDEATGLVWQRSDSGRGMTWEEALEYAQDLDVAGFDDWRLPNAKELQSIVDYTRSPQSTCGPAIDPIFAISEITDERGQKNWPFFWSGTTHLDGPRPGGNAVYVAFGEALGQMHGRIIDVHGAGAQRSDPKTGRKADYPQYHGPQGDVRRVFNYVRCVRGVGNPES